MATVLALGAGCSKECDGLFYCPDLPGTVAVDSREDADAVCVRARGPTNPDGGTIWCICSCEN